MALLRILLVVLATCCYLSSSRKLEVGSLRDVPVDVLASFFENLKVSDLQRVIESDRALMKPVLWAFRKNLGSKLFGINSDFFRQDMNISTFMGQWSKDTFFRHEFDIFVITKNMFELFGNNIKRLHISFSYLNSTEIAEINQLIQDKCANQLKHFEISASSDEVLSDMIPFTYPNVEHVSFSWCNLMNENSTIDLNEKFPNMRSLQFQRVTTRWARVNVNFEIAPLQMFDHHFPHLERLDLELVPITDTIIATHVGVDEDVEKILVKNPQVKSVYVGGFDFNFLSSLHDNLRNLEHLELGMKLPQGFFYHHIATTFETVKRFSINMAFNRGMVKGQIFIPIRFTQLEELKLSTIESQLGQVWCDFIESNGGLTKFTIGFSDRQCGKYAYLADLNLPLLREIELERIDLESADEIDSFFGKIHQLPALERIVLAEIPNIHTETVRQKIPAGWKMTKYENIESNDSFDVVITKD